jgi:hypothetical protein
MYMNLDGVIETAAVCLSGVENCTRSQPIENHLGDFFILVQVNTNLVGYGPHAFYTLGCVYDRPLFWMGPDSSGKSHNAISRTNGYFRQIRLGLLSQGR